MPGTRVSCAEPSNEGEILRSQSKILPRASAKSKVVFSYHSPRSHRARGTQKAQLNSSGILVTRCHHPLLRYKSDRAYLQNSTMGKAKRRTLRERRNANEKTLVVALSKEVQGVPNSITSDLGQLGTRSCLHPLTL